MPTICRLNGGVYGGSTDLALACDFRIGVDTAEMFMPAARLGLHYYKSGIERYVTRLGVDNAKKLFLTAQKISAPEMLRIGYLTAMVPMEMLDEEVDKLANILAGNAPVAMRGMKRAINEFARGKLDEDAAEPAPPREHARRRDQGRHQGVCGEASRQDSRFFLLPLWEKVARTKSATDEGSLSAETTPHPPSLREGTFSHKGRREEKMSSAAPTKHS